MSSLTIEQKTVNALFRDTKLGFLIPDYQRPYAWEIDECQTLWEDFFTFAFPGGDCNNFDSTNDEYFLGPIVTFKNSSGKLEVIDGQQRLITLTLLLRAFYEFGQKQQDKNSRTTRENIAKCIWMTDEFDNPDQDSFKIDSEVATEKDTDEFLSILRDGSEGTAYKEQESNYAINYKFFREQIENFLEEYSAYFALFPTRILNNCVLLPIEANSQASAFRIFMTLNDRGLPLSDTDIFKAQFYKFYVNRDKKNEFIKRWKDLDELCEKTFHWGMADLFTEYMYYERALQGETSTTTEGLRLFYEKDHYRLLKKEETFENLVLLAKFWSDVFSQNEDRFSNRVLQRLFVLNYAPNGMWTYLVSVYFMHHKDTNGNLDDDAFYTFLNKITAFIWAYAIANPGVNALRTPIYPEMCNIVKGVPVTFCNHKFDVETLKNLFQTYEFNNRRPITKSMLAWWAFQNEEQELLSIYDLFDIEHIYARNRFEFERTLQNPKSLTLLGNKSLLEKKINIRASDYKFADKKRYYLGTPNSRKKGTNIQELRVLAEREFDFTEESILARNQRILDEFIKYLKSNELVQS